ncbi:hypothetical protein AB0P21_15335 [Kribbella sp. NPDC056861]|uniref:hypothetical protein n=1 Tax=Kribbella sp. NPDC056861 TaxID=3154857 RepID=UPI0034431DCB
MDHEAKRARLERVVATLVGERLVGITYSDLPAEPPWARGWDFGDWHHAVMGVNLVLESGPASITWTDTFEPYGLEVFRAPLAITFVSQDYSHVDTWDAGNHPEWRGRIGASISAASLSWLHVETGPACRVSDGVQVRDGYEVDMPVGLRLDFGAAGARPVWFVAAVPNIDEPDEAQVGWDEIMVVFAADKLRRLNFTDQPFLAGSDSPEVPR